MINMYDGTIPISLKVSEVFDIFNGLFANTELFGDIQQLFTVDNIFDSESMVLMLSIANKTLPIIAITTYKLFTWFVAFRKYLIKQKCRKAVAKSFESLSTYQKNNKKD